MKFIVLIICVISSEPMDINECQLDTTSFNAKEDLSQCLNSLVGTNFLSNDEIESQEHFNSGETDITSDELSSNPIKDINFEINLTNVKSLETQPGLTVTFKCVECSRLFATYSDLVYHIIIVHQNKPSPSQSPQSPLTCKECAMPFNTTELLNEHIKEQHIVERIQCSMCPNQEEFKSMAELNRHKRDSHSLKCNKCGRLFYNQEELDKHMVSKHDDRLVCKICDKVLSSVQGRKTHELTHTDRSEMCWICGLVVKNKQVLQQHLQGHSDETFPCDECDKLFPSQLYLKRHKKTHLEKIEERCFICHICPKRFLRKTHLNKHLSAHSEGRIFRCHFCGRGFKGNEKLVLHEATREALGGVCPIVKKSSHLSEDFNDLNKKHKLTDEEKGSLECDVCGRKFMKVFNANRHRRYHFCNGNPEVVQKLLDEPEVYKCDKCGKRFFTKHAVQSHMALKHTGVPKPFACEFCPKTFRTRPQITVHERVHSGERPYSCSECGKSFQTKTHLRHHETVHSDEKTHICPLCPLAFKSRSLLLEHTFNHKGNNVKYFIMYL